MSQKQRRNDCYRELLGEGSDDERQRSVVLLAGLAVRLLPKGIIDDALRFLNKYQTNSGLVQVIEDVLTTAQDLLRSPPP